MGMRRPKWWMVTHLLPVWPFKPLFTLGAVLCASGHWHQRLSNSKASYLEGGRRHGGHHSFDLFSGRSPQTLCPSFKAIWSARYFLLKMPSGFWKALPLLNPSALILPPLPVGISHRELPHPLFSWAKKYLYCDLFCQTLLQPSSLGDTSVSSWVAPCILENWFACLRVLKPLLLQVYTTLSIPDFWMQWFLGEKQSFCCCLIDWFVMELLIGPFTTLLQSKGLSRIYKMKVGCVEFVVRVNSTAVGSGLWCLSWLTRVSLAVLEGQGYCSIADRTNCVFFSHIAKSISKSGPHTMLIKKMHSPVN